MALLLLFCLLPLGACASEEADPDTGQEEVLPESEEIFSEDAPVPEDPVLTESSGTALLFLRKKK